MCAAENEIPPQAFEISYQLLGIAEPANCRGTRWRWWESCARYSPPHIILNTLLTGKITENFGGFGRGKGEGRTKIALL